jgi:hypothetical protein
VRDGGGGEKGLRREAKAKGTANGKDEGAAVEGT